MMRFLALSLFVACAPTAVPETEPDPTVDDTDTTEETGQPLASPVPLYGLDTSAWVMATEPPTPGATLTHQFTFAGAMDPYLVMDGHWTDMYADADTGEVFCAVSWQMASEVPTIKSGCDASWDAVAWQPVVTHGSAFCEEVLGEAPRQVAFADYQGVGWCVIPATLCTQEQGGAWLLAEWDGLVERAEDGFIVQREQAYTVPSP